MLQKKKFFITCTIQNGMIELCVKIVSSFIGVSIEKSHIAHVELKYSSPTESSFTKSLFVRFHDIALRMKIFDNKRQAEISKIFMEEWLTENRAKLMRKCKKLLGDRLIENVKTKDGDIIVIFKDKQNQQLIRKETLIEVSDNYFSKYYFDYEILDT